MNASSRNGPDDIEKQAYVRNIEAQLLEKQARLNHIKRTVKETAGSRRTTESQQLVKAWRHTDNSIESLQEQLELLINADDQSWSSRRYEVEAAWDELSQAIKKVVATTA